MLSLKITLIIQDQGDGTFWHQVEAHCGPVQAKKKEEDGEWTQVEQTETEDKLLQKLFSEFSELVIKHTGMRPYRTTEIHGENYKNKPPIIDPKKLLGLEENETEKEE